jgi:predicted membrane-bound dolichyl-phosphate-mannose-protein mannosyltransferase
MDPSTLATVLWSGFFVALVLAAVGIRRSPDRSGLALALVASVLMAGFSVAAALSIGPFTMTLTAIITALAVARGLPARPGRSSPLWPRWARRS